MAFSNNASSVAIRCACSPQTQCPHSSSVCFSTTGCYHSLKLDPIFNHVVDDSFGCFSNNTNQVDLHCRQPKVQNLVVLCCAPSDGDFCNKHLAPELPRSAISAFFAFRNHAAVGLVVILPLLTLCIGILAIAMFWHYVLRARLKQYRLPFEIHLDTIAEKQLASSCDSFCPRAHYASCCLKPSETNLPEETLALNKVDKANRVLATYTSGSGSGLPFLVQRTIARHIELECCIGTGRFGEVWRGTYQEETVAVKIFSSRDEASWARETEVYSTGLIQHPNLLAYYASDMISRGGCTQLWLITAYHANGSLFDYLNRVTLDLRDCLKIVRSIASGLSFLHSEIRGLQFKPAIAHRDIKSKNILIRDDKEACIADLGLAMIQSKPEGSTQCSSVNYSAGWNMSISDGFTAGLSNPSSFGPPQPPCPRVGTKRYMAPELLLAVESSRQTNAYIAEKSSEFSEESFIGQSTFTYLPFEVYQAADVYAMALVFWEILRCSRGLGTEHQTVEGYEIPFHGLVPADPTFSQMRSVVCPGSLLSTSPSGSPTNESTFADCRPRISARWLNDPYLNRVAKLVQECWHPEWESRLSALRVRKKVESIESAFLQHPVRLCPH